MWNRIQSSYATATSLDTTDRLCTSWLLPPLPLCLFRATISLYAFVVLFTILGHTAGTVYPSRSFSYFTVLGYWGLAFYFGVAAIQTGSLWWRGRSFVSGWPAVLRWAHGGFYASVTTFPFVVTSEWIFSFSSLHHPSPHLSLSFQKSEKKPRLIAYGLSNLLGPPLNRCPSHKLHHLVQHLRARPKLRLRLLGTHPLSREPQRLDSSPPRHCAVGALSRACRDHACHAGMVGL